MRIEEGFLSSAQAARASELRSKGLGRLATDAEKNWISVLADAANARGVVDAMRDLDPWSDSSWRPVSMGGWYSSTDALAKVSNPEGLSTFQRFGASAAGGAATAVTGVDIHAPGEADGFIGELGRSMGGATANTSITTKKWYDEASDTLKKALDLPWWAYALVIGVPVLYFGGGFIKAAGNLAHRATR